MAASREGRVVTEGAVFLSRKTSVERPAPASLRREIPRIDRAADFEVNAAADYLEPGTECPTLAYEPSSERSGTARTLHNESRRCV